MADDEETSAEQVLLQRQKRELKQLQSEIQKLKHSVPKGDKKRKKEVTAQVSQLEAELKERHEKELENHKNCLVESVDAVAAGLQLTDITDSCDHGDVDQGATAGSSEVLQRSKKSSKAQRRREKKAQQDRDREDRIKEQDVVNLTGSRHLEAQKLKSILGARSLGIQEVPSDGNCLYAALADQLKRQNIEASVAHLRKEAADHMRQNQDDFWPFLCKPDTGEPYTTEEYEDYCNKLENTAEWGGQLELRALSNVYNKPIEVVQAEAPIVLVGEDFTSPKLILSYHHHAYGLGEHYNSVIDKALIPDTDEEDGFT